MHMVFTIVSRNYASQAITLMQSLLAADPEVQRIVVAADGPLTELEPWAEVISAEDVLPGLAAMSVYYEALELNTAIKPHVFRHLLRREDIASVTYLDPDIQVFRPLEHVRASLRKTALCLIPHLTRPLVGPTEPNNITILRSGAYNLGFLAARRTPNVMDLMDWWGEACRFDCRVDMANGLFTDQKWMDLAPGFVDSVTLLRDPSLNLAYWNLDGRRLEKKEGGWHVDGKPLVFFHFSGFDPSRPNVLSKHQNRLTVEPGSSLAQLLEEYARQLLRNGYADHQQRGYAFDRFPSGRRLTHLMRQTALRAARNGEDLSAGLCRDTDNWMDQPDPGFQSPRLPDVSRLMVQAWLSSRAADWFDLGTVEGRTGFARWFIDQADSLELDEQAVASARCLTLQGGLAAEGDAPPWREAPWTGPARDIADWLKGGDGEVPRACQALVVARCDLRARFHDDPDGLVAWCLGPEALAGRFSPALLPDQWLHRLGEDPYWPARAARFAEAMPPRYELNRRVRAGFGIAVRARWPETLYRPLRTAYLQPAEALPAPFIRLFIEIWNARADVQREYPLDRPLGRFRYLRWLLGTGFGEYGIEIESLPDGILQHPLLRMAAWTLPRRFRNEPSASRGRLDQLAIVEHVEDGLFFPGAHVVAAANLRSGTPQSELPAEVQELILAVPPAVVPADLIGLRARGVRWNRAVGAWDAKTVQALYPDSATLGFVDEIWTTRRGQRVDLPRPVLAQLQEGTRMPAEGRQEYRS